MKLALESRDGVMRDLQVSRWHEPATPGELALLADMRPPALDVGCGPGRIAHALASMGVPALGIDVAPEAIRTATETGAIALCRSVFDPVPGEGRWSTVLLLDGNVGIGGDPLSLLSRCAELGREGADLIVEVDPPGMSGSVTEARIHTAGEPPGPWFPWATVSASDLDSLAPLSGTELNEVTDADGRWFARLRVCPTRPLATAPQVRSYAVRGSSVRNPAMVAPSSS